jgi:hypothetical protein
MRIRGPALLLSVALGLTSVATPSFAVDWGAVEGSVAVKRDFGKTKVCCKVKGRIPVEPFVKPIGAVAAGALGWFYGIKTNKHKD